MGINGHSSTLRSMREAFGEEGENQVERETVHPKRSETYTLFSNVSIYLPFWWRSL